MAFKWNLDGVNCNMDNVLIYDTFTVASVPDSVAGGVVYVSNGAAGNPCIAFGDGTNWKRCDTLANISAS